VKKVLIVAYSFPPRSGIGSQRPHGLAKYLPRYGWAPIILTAKLPGKPPEGIRVIETDYKDITKNLKSGIGLSTEHSVHEQLGTIVSKGNNPVTWKSKVIKYCKEIILFPDNKRGWYRYAIDSASQLLKTEDISAIISTSPPAISHIIASKLRRKSGVKWVADFRDPWSQKAVADRSAILKYFDKLLEIITISTADQLVSVTQPYVDKIKELHANKTVHCITNGYDDESFQEDSPELTGKFTITHTGTLYNGRRDPSILFAAVNELIKENKINKDLIDIRFYGSEEDWLVREIKRCELGEVVKSYGRIPFEEALIKQKESQLLLVIRWDNTFETGNMPAKIYEYMHAKRPVIGIGNHGGIVNDILKETNAGKFAENRAEMKNHLMEYYNEFLKHGKVNCQSNSNIKNYTHNIMAKKYAEVLNNLIAS